MSSQERKYSSPENDGDWQSPTPPSQQQQPQHNSAASEDRKHSLQDRNGDDDNAGSPIPSLSDSSSVGSVGHPSLPLIQRNTSSSLLLHKPGIRAPLANSPQHGQTSDTDPDSDPIEEVVMDDRKAVTPEISEEDVEVSKVSTPEPDDFTLPHTELIFENFTALREEAARARANYRPDPFHRIPFSLLGAKFDLRVYPCKTADGGVGLFLEKTDNVPVAAIFRVVVFRGDVYEEAVAKVKTNGGQVTFNGGYPVISPALSEALPSNDVRNASVQHLEIHTFIINTDFGFANAIPSSKCDQYAVESPDAKDKDFLLIRIYMQRKANKSLCKPLASFSKNNVAVTKQWPFVGLNNQGATCFVYAIPVHPDQMQMLLAGTGSYSAASTLSALRSPSPGTNSASTANTPSVSQALQFLFYQLQTAPKSVSTEALTASFGWGRAHAFEQHDVQEFSRKLLEHLEETAKKQSPPLPIITKLFEGKQQSYIECTNVAFTSKRTEEYLDLSLNVVNMPTLVQSLRDYVAEEMLTGPNQYRAKSDKVDHGPQDAKKGIRILEFPPLLQLQLKRFTYDMMSGDMMKVDSKFAFPDVLDLTEFESVEVEQDASESKDGEKAEEEKKQSEPKVKNDNGPPIYYLHSVLVHRGSMKGGHYYAYVKPFPSDSRIAYEKAPWFKFDDETVSICGTSAEAIEKNYGESYTEVSKSLGKTYTRDIRLSGSAYMLIYVRKNFVETKGMDPHAPPPQIVAADSFVESKEDVEMTDTKTTPLLPLTNQSSLPTEAPDAESDQSPLLPADFCDTPDDLDSFIDLLRPQPVPLPQHIEDGIEEARLARLKADEEAAAIARRIHVNIIAEPKLIFRGLNSSTDIKGQAGVAGLKFQVAPFPHDSNAMSLSQFSFSGKSDAYVFQKSDTLASIQEQMEKAYDIPIARQQFWLLDPQKQDFLYIMQHGLSLEKIGGNPQGTTFFLRDSNDVDSVPKLTTITHNSGNLPTVPSNPLQLERFPFGNQDRRLLLLKFFDVHTQMMYYLGSAVVFTIMSEAEFKYFVTELLKHKGIDVELRNRARRAIIDSYPSFIQNLPSAPDQEPGSLPEYPSIQLTDVFAKAAETTDADRAKASAASAAATDAAAQVTEQLAHKLAYDETDRWNHYKKRAAKGDTSVHDIPISAIYIQSEIQLTKEPSRTFAPFNSSSSNFRSTADHIRSLTKPDSTPNPNPFSFNDHSAFTSIREADWKSGSVLVIHEALPAEMKACVQSLWEKRTAVITNAPMEDSEPHATFQMPPELDLFAPLLHPLPLPHRESTFLSPKDYVHHLTHRAVVEFCPAVTIPDTGEVVAFDRNLFPNHPFAHVDSFAMELDVDMQVEQMLASMVEALKERISSDVWNKYSQLHECKYYKLWHQASLRNDQPFVISGDILSSRAFNADTLYDLNVAQVVNKGAIEKAAAINKFKMSSTGTGTSTSVLFFELLPIPLEKLLTHWWLTYRYVNEKGESMTLPSDFPALWPEKPFFVAKGKQIQVDHLQKHFIKEVLFPKRHEYGLDQYQFKCNKTILHDSQPADSDKMIDVRASDSSNSHKRELASTDRPDSTQANKKMKIETGSIVTSTKENAIDCTDSPIAATPMPEMSEHTIYHGIYTPNPVSVNVSESSTEFTWMLHSVNRPLQLYYHRWRNDYSFDLAMETITKHYGEALPMLKAASDAAAPSQDIHRTFPRFKNIKSKSFTQPIPLPFYFNRLHDGDGTFHMWIPRFTTPAATLKNNQTYALSPLPPIYYSVRKGETYQELRKQLAAQLGKQPSEVHLARLKPSSYDVFPDDDAATANQYMEEIIIGLDNPKSILGLHDTVSTHTNSYSGLDRGSSRPGSALLRKSAEFNISRNA